MKYDRHICGRIGMCILLIIILIKPVAAQQEDFDSTFQANVLGYEDLGPLNIEKDKLISAANRVPENSEEIAVRTYIITRDDIARNGYTSLNDILRNLPGFRTSSPGSALVGEYFTMRGLLGNLYTKILINGIPVLPSAAPGFPLGSQLPVKQAERVEIILGPASSVYGNDAMAGVINIVIPEVERPVEVMSNVAINDAGQTEFHVSLGGKIGRAKNVAKYRFYGSSVMMPDRNLYLPDDLIRVDTLLVAGNPYYHSEKDYSIPKIDRLPHDNRLMGLALSFKGFNFLINSMYRKEHSAIGWHPVEVSYDDPGAEIADNITNFMLQHEFEMGKFWFHTNVSYNRYRMDAKSNYQGIYHPLANGRSFLFSSSDDYFAEQLINYRSGAISVLAGGAYNLRSGEAFQNFLARPFGDENITYDQNGIAVLENSEDTLSLIGKYSPYQSYKNSDWGTFLQATYSHKLFNITSGIRYDKLSGQDGVFSPKVGTFIKITDVIRFRALYARSFRMPGNFFIYQNYELSKLEGEMVPSLKRFPATIHPEQLTNIEGGFTFRFNDHLSIDLHYFRHQLKNSLFPSLEFPDSPDFVPGDSIPNYSMGYYNASSLSILNGIQFISHCKVGFGANEKHSAELRVAGQYHIGSESIEDVATIESYRLVPQYQARADLFIDIDKWFRINIYNAWYSDFVHSITRVNENINVREAGGFYTMDVVIGRSFSRQLDAYVRIRNLTNSVEKGLYMSLISRQQLDYTPQAGRQIFLGITFNLN